MTADDEQADTPTDDFTTDEPTDTTDDPPDGNGADNRTGDTRPSGGPDISLVSVNNAPDAPVEHEVKVIEDFAIDKHPPQVRITLTNTGDGTVEVDGDKTVLFQYVSDATSGLIFLLADEGYPVGAGCWRPEDHIAVTEGYRIPSLRPDGSRSELMDPYGVARSKGDEASCLPVGELHLEADFATGEFSGSDGERQEMTRGFSLMSE